MSAASPSHNHSVQNPPALPPQATAIPAGLPVAVPIPAEALGEPIAAGRVSPMIVKNGDKEEAPPRKEANEKADPKKQELKKAESLAPAAAKMVQGAVEAFFHIDHRLRKWPRVFSAPKVVDQRIQGEADLNKKAEAFNKAFPALVKLALEKMGEENGLAALLSALPMRATTQDSLVRSQVTLSAKLEEFKLKDFLATEGFKIREFAQNLSSLDFKAVYEALPAAVRAVLSTTTGTTLAVGAALDQYPLFKDAAVQATFKGHVVQLVEQISGPLTSAVKEEYRHLIQAVIVMKLYAIVDALQKMSEKGENNENLQVLLQIVQAQLDDGLKILGRIAFSGKANDVAKPLPQLMEALFKPLRDFEAFASEVSKGVANPQPLAQIPDSYWEKLKGSKEMPELDLLIQSVKVQYGEVLKSLSLVDPLKTFKRNMQLTIAKIGMGQDIADDLKKLQGESAQLEGAFKELGTASPFYKLFKTLSKECDVLPGFASALQKYKAEADKIKANEKAGKPPTSDDHARLEMFGDMGISAMLQFLEETMGGQAYIKGGVLLPTMKAVYMTLEREMSLLFQKYPHK